MPIFPRFADGATPAAPGEDTPLLISAYDAFFRRDAYGLAEDWTPLLPMTVGGASVRSRCEDDRLCCQRGQREHPGCAALPGICGRAPGACGRAVVHDAP